MHDEKQYHQMPLAKHAWPSLCAFRLAATGEAPRKSDGATGESNRAALSTLAWWHSPLAAPRAQA